MDERIVQEIGSALDAGEAIELCLLVETTGSSPRKAGACLVLHEDGAYTGTIGGGALERLALKEAASLLAARSSAIHSYTMNGAGSDTGMICGGDATVCHLALDARQREAVDMLIAARRERRRSWLTVRLDRDAPRVAFVAEADDGRAERPVFIDAAAWDRALTGDEAVLEGASFILPCTPEGRVFIFGAGHVGAALVPVVAGIGFDVVVYDERPELASPERLALASEVIVAPFSEVSQRVKITPRDYAVVCTPRHVADLAVVKQVLAAHPRYVGCLGSAKKTAFIHGELAAAGLSDEEISCLHMPIGIPLGDETPQEIAISITAEIITVRRGFAQELS